MVEGHGQVEEGLENAVEVGRIKEIDATDDIGDSLESVVDDNGPDTVGGAGQPRVDLAPCFEGEDDASCG